MFYLEASLIGKEFCIELFSRVFWLVNDLLHLKGALLEFFSDTEGKFDIEPLLLVLLIVKGSEFLKMFYLEPLPIGNECCIYSNFSQGFFG